MYRSSTRMPAKIGSFCAVRYLFSRFSDHCKKVATHSLKPSSILNLWQGVRSVSRFVFRFMTTRSVNWSVRLNYISSLSSLFHPSLPHSLSLSLSLSLFLSFLGARGQAPGRSRPPRYSGHLLFARVGEGSSFTVVPPPPLPAMQSSAPR